MTTLSCLKAVENGVQLRVQVLPRASRTELIEIKGDLLRIRLTSPPVGGAANKLCREYLAKVFGIAKSRVTLIQGEKSRVKQWHLQGVHADVVKGRLLELLR